MTASLVMLTAISASPLPAVYQSRGSNRLCQEEKSTLSAREAPTPERQSASAASGPGLPALDLEILLDAGLESGICPPSPRLAHWIRASAWQGLAVPDPQVQGLLEGGQGGINGDGAWRPDRITNRLSSPRPAHGQESARLHPIGRRG